MSKGGDVNLGQGGKGLRSNKGEGLGRGNKGEGSENKDGGEGGGVGSKAGREAGGELADQEVKGEPELTDPFNLLINVKLRMLWNWNFFYLKEHFCGNIVS